MENTEEFGPLLERVRQGDEQAATELVRMYEPEVRRFIRYRLNSPRMKRFLDSVDICQSIFANFFVKVADGDFDLRHPRQLQQLLLTMAGNRLLDHARKQGTERRGGKLVIEPQEGDWVADSTPGPAKIAEVRDMVDVVRARLKPDEITLLDQWMNGDDWQAIAERTGISAEAVRKRVTRALDRVAQEMGLENLK